MDANGGGGQLQGPHAAPAQPELLNSLVEAALPPSCTLQHLELSCCLLDTVSLQHLPALSNLQQLDVKACWAADGMDAPLQALVQRAPALLSLFFEVDVLYKKPAPKFHLRRWPAYLLAHPSLRSATVLTQRKTAFNSEHASRDAAEPASRGPGECM